jgi:hypothetical protein
LGRFVSAYKLWLDAAIVLAVELALALDDVTGVLDNEVVVAELDEEPLVDLVPAPDVEPLADVAPTLDEEPLLDAAPELGEEPLIEVVGPAPDGDPDPADGDPDPDVVTAAGVRVAACAVPILPALLPLHAASITNAALLISAATESPSDKFRFISLILRFVLRANYAHRG